MYISVIRSDIPDDPNIFLTAFEKDAQMVLINHMIYLVKGSEDFLEDNAERWSIFIDLTEKKQYKEAIKYWNSSFFFGKKAFYYELDCEIPKTPNFNGAGK